MQLDMQDFRTMVGKLAKDPQSASMKVDDHPHLDRPHAVEFGFDLEDKDLVEDADSVLDLSIKDFNMLLDQLSS